jgi:peptidoglycan hydrolase CwlO-like protein
MANILGIFTAIVLAAAIFIGLKNNTRLEEEISKRQDRERILKTNSDNLRELQAVLEALPIERKGIDDEFAVKTTEETALKDEVAELKSEIEAKTQEITTNKEELEAIREKTAKVGNIRELASKMKAMRTDREDLEQQIEANEAKLANLTEQNQMTQADSDRRKEELEILSKGQSLPTLKTRIRTIYATWGFVTLGDGNNAGVNANSTLDVVRDGDVIAKLLVTAVESRSASATIIPDSIVADVTLMVGDMVVPSVKTQNTPAEN